MSKSIPGESTAHLTAGTSLAQLEAGIPHRFEDFTHDFAVWVMYFGPEGGEH